MNLRAIIIGIGIFVLTMFVAIYGISVVFPQPQYEDFCSPTGMYPKFERNDTICPAVCVEMYEIKNGSCVPNECGSGCGPDAVTSFDTLEQCEIVLSGKNCWELHNEAMKDNSMKRFLLAVPIGVALIVLGNALFALEVVGVGLMAGGAGTMIWGAGSYWGYASDLWRFLISLVGLVVLIWFAYWFERKNRNFLDRIFRKER